MKTTLLLVVFLGDNLDELEGEEKTRLVDIWQKKAKPNKKLAKRKSNNTLMEYAKTLNRFAKSETGID